MWKQAIITTLKQTESVLWDKTHISLIYIDAINEIQVDQGTTVIAGTESWTSEKAGI